MRHRTLFALLVIVSTALTGCSRSAKPTGRTFETPEAAVAALIAAAKSSNVTELTALFGPDSKNLVESADPKTARQNRDVFVAATAEGWHLSDEAGGKVLVIGKEDWPFPVPLVKDRGVWRFDAAAGEDEVLSRRVGRNELAAIRTARTYVAAQHFYSAHGHDSQPAGAYAISFKSDPGRQNGLYWPSKPGEPRSPLGALMEEAEQRANETTPSPFHGYYFRILTGQGTAAPGGARSYLTGNRMTSGFAMVAWPAYYGQSGVMTFIVNQDGIVHQKDLGAGTDGAAKRIQLYDPDASWTALE